LIASKAKADIGPLAPTTESYSSHNYTSKSFWSEYLNSGRLPSQGLH